MSEKLCLQWNDFQENVKVAFRDLRGDETFTDVTLACEDGQQVEVHKVILAASSPFFKKLLERNKHLHPLIYMRGLKSDDPFAIIDFLYCGEANVFQENLDCFLSIAEELQLKGLMGKTGEKGNAADTKIEPEITRPFEENVATAPKSVKQRDLIIETEKNGTVSLSTNFASNFEELEATVKSMMEKSQNLIANGRQKADKCKVCGKEGKTNAIKDHIEANHLEGIVFPCNHCRITTRTRNGLRQHNAKNHSAAII